MGSSQKCGAAAGAALTGRTGLLGTVHWWWCGGDISHYSSHQKLSSLHLHKQLISQ